MCCTQPSILLSLEERSQSVWRQFPFKLPWNLYQLEPNGIRTWQVQEIDRRAAIFGVENRNAGSLKGWENVMEVPGIVFDDLRPCRTSNTEVRCYAMLCCFAPIAPNQEPCHLQSANLQICKSAGCVGEEITSETFSRQTT